MAFGTDESVLFIELSSIRKCPYREVPLYTSLYMLILTSYSVCGGGGGGGGGMRVSETEFVCE